MTQGSNNFVSDQFECGSYHVVRNRISRGNVVGSTRREAILRPLQFIEFVTHYFLLLGANPEFRKTYCSKADALSQRKLTESSGSCLWQVRSPRDSPNSAAIRTDSYIRTF